MSDDKGNGAPSNGAELSAEQNDSSVEERLAKAEAEAADLKDKLLRALAETENVRRRADREAQSSTKYAIERFAKDLLDAADNLRRALASVPEHQVNDDLTRTLLAGVAATERGLLAAFERHGIKRIDPKGERFDHNLHQAVFEAENTGKPPGTVIEVLAPGYLLQDRLLRPAMVGVAKGEAKPPEPPTERFDAVV
jgi:molecular chaperone GrpE